MLHGSGGGTDGTHQLANAAILASEGFLVLRYCYFDCNRRRVSIRETLHDVDISKIIEVIDWLKNHKLNSVSKVAVVGVSRGAELALLLGALNLTSIPAITAHAPSDVLWAF